MSATAAIHVARKQLGLDDDEARALYAEVTGKRSLREMSDGERGRVIEALRKRGFTPSSSPRRKPLEGPFAKKLQALWIAAWNLGIVRNRDDRALIAFVERQASVSHTRFLHHKDDADKVIEGLKRWMAREAGVVWQKSDIGEAGWRWLHRDGAKVALAQWQYLVSAGRCPIVGGFAAYLREIVGADFNGFAEITDRQWITVMNALGEHVRRVRKAAGRP